MEEAYLAGKRRLEKMSSRISATNAPQLMNGKVGGFGWSSPFLFAWLQLDMNKRLTMPLLLSVYETRSHTHLFSLQTDTSGEKTPSTM